MEINFRDTLITATKILWRKKMLHFALLRIKNTLVLTLSKLNDFPLIRQYISGRKSFICSKKL